MKERPILFSGPMVRAILDGRKRQTRRVMKVEHEECPFCDDTGGYPVGDGYGGCQEEQCEWCWTTQNSLFNVKQQCPYGVAGDRLWVRETFMHYANGWRSDGPCCVQGHVKYKADGAGEVKGSWPDFCYAPKEKWWNTGRRPYKPSIHMPRWASRITLEVIGVRVERVQDISEEDAIAEGVGHGFQMNGGWPDYQHIDSRGMCTLTQDSARLSFCTLWYSINGKPRKDGVDISWAANPWVWVVEFRKIDVDNAT